MQNFDCEIGIPLKKIWDNMYWLDKPKDIMYDIAQKYIIQGEYK